MNAYSARRPRNFDWARAFLASVVVHLVLVLVWVAALVLEFYVVKASEVLEEVTPEPAAFVQMTTEMVQLLETAEVAPPEPTPAEKSFQPTRPNQESAEEVKSDRYFGERSTQAASELPGSETGLAVPTQDGREQRNENDLELASAQFSDGDTEGAPGTPGEPRPLPEESIVQEELKPKEEEVQEEPNETEVENESVADTIPLFQPTSEQRMELAQQEAARLLALENSIPVPEKEEQPEPVEEPAVEEAIPEPKKVTKASEPTGGQIGQRGAESGFERQAEKTRVSGTIRRVGESSVDVEDSVKGRYLAEVNRQIERAWQRECILRREHILPGVLSVSFIMDEKGSVKGFRFDSRIAGGAIQEGFTLRAVKKADLPEMPAEMASELNGSPLEMSLTFFF